MLASFALIEVFAAQPPTSRTTTPSSAKTAGPLSPFPEQTQWTLALNNRLVALPAYAASAGYFPIDGDRIAAYDLLTGTQLWMVSARPRSAPAVAGGRLFVEEKDGLAALDAKNGSIVWRVPLSETLVVPLASDSGWLVAATAAAVLTFRAVDGSLSWHHDLGARAHGAPAVAGDRIFIPVDDGRVIAFRADTGEKLWEHRLGAAANDILASANRLFVGSNDNYLYCLNTQDGEIVWRARTGADVVSRPTVDEHRVYFVSLDNILRALNRRNGVQQWKQSLPFRPVWGPIKVFDAVVVAGPQGPLRAYYLKGGTPAGEMSTGTDELAAPVYTFESPMKAGPVIVVVTRNLASGAKLTAVRRSFEPPVASVLPALPGTQLLAPATRR